MARFVVLANWTQEGVAQARGTVERSERVRRMAERHGGRVEVMLWTLGRYDIVAVIQMPSAEAMTTLALEISALGTVRTETLQAFGAEEMSGIVAALGT